MQNFWCAAQLQPGRDGLALYFLRQGGFLTYAPRFREPRTVRGRQGGPDPATFPQLRVRPDRTAMARSEVVTWRGAPGHEWRGTRGRPRRRHCGAQGARA